MDIDPVEVIRTLGSIASISSGYLNVKKAIIDNGRAKRDAGDKLQGTLTTEERQTILQPRIQASGSTPTDIDSIHLIDSDLLDSAMQRIKAARQRLVQAVRSGQISEIEEEDALARHEVCYLLSFILQHNGGQFPPHGQLNLIWRQFRCTALHPQFGIRSY